MHLERLLGVDRLKSDLDVLIGESWRDSKGIIQTFRAEPMELLGYQLTEGIFTGMTPGFTLYALSRHRQDLAEKAFNAFPTFVTTSGNVTEDFSAADLLPLMPIYDVTGGQGEIWARFRAWEGGQDGEAILHYLTGFVPDAAAKEINLSPNLPNNWNSASYTGLLAAGCLFDMTITERADNRREHTLAFTGDACNGLKVNIRTATWSCGTRDICSPTTTVTAGGAVLAQSVSGMTTFAVKAGMQALIVAESTLAQ